MKKIILTLFMTMTLFSLPTLLSAACDETIELIKGAGNSNGAIDASSWGAVETWEENVYTRDYQGNKYLYITATEPKAALYQAFSTEAGAKYTVRARLLGADVNREEDFTKGETYVTVEDAVPTLDSGSLGRSQDISGGTEQKISFTFTATSATSYITLRGTKKWGYANARDISVKADCNNKILSVNGPTKVYTGETATVSVEYSSGGDHKITVGLERTEDPYDGYWKTINVTEGTRTVDVTLNIPEDVTPSTNFLFQAFIHPADGGWKERFHHLNQRPIELASIDNKVLAITAADSVIRGDTITVPIEYSSGGDHEITLKLQLNHDPWTNQVRQTLSTHRTKSGKLNFTLKIPKDTNLGTDYEFLALIHPVGGGWNNKYHYLEKNPIEVKDQPDNIKPVITLVGETPIRVELGDTYNDAGATASDDTDGDISANIKVASTVNTSQEGTYTVTYNVSDAAGNAADTVTRTVTVKKTLDCLAETDANLIKNACFEREINPWKPFNYKGKGGIGTWVDNEGHSGRHSIKVVNPENNSSGWEHPYIEINHKKTITIVGWNKALNVDNEALNALDFYIEFEDGTYEWYYPGELQFSKGTHGWEKREITHTFDKAIVKVKPVALLYYHSGTVWFDDIRIIVVDDTKPIITLTGEAYIEIDMGSEYHDKGATATDDVDGDITDKILTNPTVDTSQEGTYTVTYNVTDAAGNAADTVTRTVKVIDPGEPCLAETDANLIKNACFEQTYKPWEATEGAINGWVEGVGHSGRHSVKIHNSKDLDSVWHYPEISIDHKRRFTFDGWNKAQDLNSSALNSLVFLVRFADSTEQWYYPKEIQFSNGTHDWEHKKVHMTFEKEVTSIKPYALLYYSTGTAWFDDIRIVIDEKDLTKPIITLVGDTPVELTLGDDYTEAGATAYDETDGDITQDIKITSSVDDTKEGTYTVTYDVTDAAGNVADTVTRTVIVKKYLACTVETDANYVKNACFEQDSDPWIAYGGAEDGWVNNLGHSGTHSVKIVNKEEQNSGWYYPAIDIDYKRTITFGGWNKALDVNNTALNCLDFRIDFVDGTYIWYAPNKIRFSKGTHDWEHREITETFDKAIVRIRPYTLLYYHSGTAWFDDIYVIAEDDEYEGDDTTKPILTLRGDSPDYTKVGHDYSDLGARAIDDKEGDISHNIVATSNVDTTEAGTYTVTYRVSDSAGNEADPISRTVIVQEKIPCTLETDANLIVNPCFEEKVEPWITYGGGISSRWVDDEGHSGTHSVKIVAGEDQHPRWTYDAFDVNHKRTITFGGWNKALDVEKNALNSLCFLVTYADGDYTWYYPSEFHFSNGTHDWEHKEATKTFAKDVVTIKPYALFYYHAGTVWYDDIYVIVKDEENEEDTTKPVISLLGSSPLHLTVGDNYNDAGATATDNIDGDITDKIAVSSNVDTSKAGTYYVKYNVSDAAGNAADTVTRTVNVDDDNNNNNSAGDHPFRHVAFVWENDPNEDGDKSHTNYYHVSHKDGKVTVDEVGPNGTTKQLTTKTWPAGGSGKIKTLVLNPGTDKEVRIDQSKFLLPSDKGSAYTFDSGEAKKLFYTYTEGPALCQITGENKCKREYVSVDNITNSKKEWTEKAKVAFSDTNLNHYVGGDPGQSSNFDSYKDRDPNTVIHTIHYGKKGIKVGNSGDGYVIVSERGGNNSFLLVAKDLNGRYLGDIYVRRAHTNHCSDDTDASYVSSGRMQENWQEICVAVYPIQDLSAPGRTIGSIEMWAAGPNEDAGDGKVMLVHSLEEPRICYDYSVRQNGKVIPSIDRKISTIGGGEVSISVGIRSLESDFTMENSRMKLDVDASFDFKASYHAPRHINKMLTAKEINATTHEIAIGDKINPADKEGGQLSNLENSTYYSKFVYTLDNSFTGVFNIDLNYTVDTSEDQKNPIVYLSTTDSNKLVKPTNYEPITRCPQSEVYNPNYGTFNVERVDNGNSKDPNIRYPLYTQVVGKDFDFSVVAYKGNTTPPFTERIEMSNITVDLELIDASSYDDNNSFFRCGDTNPEIIQTVKNGKKNMLVHFGDSQSRVDVTDAHDLITDTALTNAAFRMWILVDNDNNLVHHNCVETDDDACWQKVYEDNLKENDTREYCTHAQSNFYQCLRDYFVTAICSRDNFSIRPASYSMSVSDSNQLSAPHSPVNYIASNTSQTPIDLAAGYDYKFDINATRYGTSTSALGYTTIFSKKFKKDRVSQMRFDDLSSCADKNNTDLNIYFSNGKVTGDFRKTDYKLSKYNVQKNGNVGAYKYHLEDLSWTRVDQARSRTKDGRALKPFPDVDDCVGFHNGVADTSKDSILYSIPLNKTAKNGCGISSYLQDSKQKFYDLSLAYKPYKFSVSDIKLYRRNNNGFIYYNDDIKDIHYREMSAKFKGLITAQGADDKNVSNFTFSCAATDVLFDVNKTVKHKGKKKKNFELETEENIPRTIHLKRNYTKNSDEENGSKALEIKSDFFEDKLKGSSKVTLYYNFERFKDGPVNPAKMHFVNNEANATDASSHADMKDDYIPTGTSDLNKDVDFVYGRVITDQASYVAPASSSTIVANLYVEIYCDYIGAACGTYATKQSSRADDYRINSKHSSDDGDGKIKEIKDPKGKLVIKESSDIDILNPTKITITIPSGVPRTYTSNLKTTFDVPWFDDTIISTEFFGGGGWVGPGKTGLILDTNASQDKVFKRTEW